MNPVPFSSFNTNTPEPQQVNSRDENSDDFRTIWSRIKGTSDNIAKLATCAVEKNEQNLIELRKLLVSLLSEATLLGLKEEILSSFLTEEEYLAYHPGKKRKRKHDPQNKKASEGLVCRVCGATETSEWRRGPDGSKSLCNACGLHYSKILRKERSYVARGNGSLSSIANPAKIDSILNPPSENSLQSDRLHMLADLFGQYNCSPISSRTPTPPTTTNVLMSSPRHIQSTSPPLLPLSFSSPLSLTNVKSNSSPVTTTTATTTTTTRLVTSVPYPLTARPISLPLFTNRNSSMAPSISGLSDSHLLSSKSTSSLQSSPSLNPPNLVTCTNNTLNREIKIETKQESHIPKG